MMSPIVNGMIMSEPTADDDRTVDSSPPQLAAQPRPQMRSVCIQTGRPMLWEKETRRSLQEIIDNVTVRNAGLKFPNRIHRCHYVGCGYNFVAKQALDEHLLSAHTSDGEFDDQKPTANGSLTGVRPPLKRRRLVDTSRQFRCDYDGCGAVFNANGNLTRHKRSKHGLSALPGAVGGGPTGGTLSGPGLPGALSSATTNATIGMKIAAKIRKKAAELKGRRTTSSSIRLVCDYNGCDTQLSSVQSMRRHQIKVHRTIPARRFRQVGAAPVVGVSGQPLAQHVLPGIQANTSSTSLLAPNSTGNPNGTEAQTSGRPIQTTDDGADVKPFRCDVEGCVSVFTVKYNLKRHMTRKHKSIGIDITAADQSPAQLMSEEPADAAQHRKVFKCDVIGCEKVYSNRSSLWSHIHGFHGGPDNRPRNASPRQPLPPTPIATDTTTEIEAEILFKCPVNECQKGLSSRYGVKRHLKRVHGIEDTPLTPSTSIDSTAADQSSEQLLRDDPMEGTDGAAGAEDLTPESGVGAAKAKSSRFECDLNGCNKSYKNFRDLCSHRQKCHATDGTNTRKSNASPCKPSPVETSTTVDTPPICSPEVVYDENWEPIIVGQTPATSADTVGTALKVPFDNTAANQSSEQLLSDDPMEGIGGDAGDEDYTPTKTKRFKCDVSGCDKSYAHERSVLKHKRDNHGIDGRNDETPKAGANETPDVKPMAVEEWINGIETTYDEPVVTAQTPGYDDNWEPVVTTQTGSYDDNWEPIVAAQTPATAAIATPVAVTEPVDVKPFPCPEIGCYKTYTTKCGLTRHQNTVHGLKMSSLQTPLKPPANVAAVGVPAMPPLAASRPVLTPVPLRPGLFIPKARMSFNNTTQQFKCDFHGCKRSFAKLENLQRHERVEHRVSAVCLPGVSAAAGVAKSPTRSPPKAPVLHQSPFNASFMSFISNNTKTIGNSNDSLHTTLPATTAATNVIATSAIVSPIVANNTCVSDVTPKRTEAVVTPTATEELIVSPKGTVVANTGASDSPIKQLSNKYEKFKSNESKGHKFRCLNQNCDKTVDRIAKIRAHVNKCYNRCDSTPKPSPSSTPIATPTATPPTTPRRLRHKCVENNCNFRSATKPEMTAHMQTDHNQS